MKKPLIIIVVAIVVIGVVYFVSQSEDAYTKPPANSANKTATSAATNTVSAKKYVGDDFTILQPAG